MVLTAWQCIICFCLYVIACMFAFCGNGDGKGPHLSHDVISFLFSHSKAFSPKCRLKQHYMFTYGCKLAIFSIAESLDTMSFFFFLSWFVNMQQDVDQICTWSIETGKKTKLESMKDKEIKKKWILMTLKWKTFSTIWRFIVRMLIFYRIFCIYKGLRLGLD